HEMGAALNGRHLPSLLVANQRGVHPLAMHRALESPAGEPKPPVESPAKVKQGDYAERADGEQDQGKPVCFSGHRGPPCMTSNHPLPLLRSKNAATATEPRAPGLARSRLGQTKSLRQHVGPVQKMRPSTKGQHRSWWRGVCCRCSKMRGIYDHDFECKRV